MASRHTARERALQMIFQWEASGDAPEKVVLTYWNHLAETLTEADEEPGESELANSLLYGVVRQQKMLDELISSHASNWKIERLSAVDRNILRLAIFEMRQPEGRKGVIITEAIELGRRFSGEQSVRFLNGVLDAVAKTLKVKGLEEDATAPNRPEAPAPSPQSPAGSRRS